MQAFEEQISQLSFWKHSTQQHVLDLERNNEGLKQRLQQFLREEDSGETSSALCRLRAHN